MAKQIKQKHKGYLDKRSWFIIHGWFGLPLWGALLLICFTGTLCTVSQEITWLYDPNTRAAAYGKEPRFDLIDASISTHFPQSKIVRLTNEEPYLAYKVRINTPGLQDRTFYINQYSGSIQGEVQAGGFREFMLSLHGWLFMPWQNDYSVGWYIVTALSLPLLGSVITAMFLLKKWWRPLYSPTLRLNRGKKLFYTDLHKVIGAWSIWFIIVIGGSGLWFLAQGILAQNNISLYPEPPTTAAYVTDPPWLDVNPKLQDVADLIKVEDPRFNIKYILYPETNNDLIVVRGDIAGSLYRDNINVIYIDPLRLSVIGAHRPDNVSTLHQIVAFMTPLHFGDFSSLTSKLIWFFFGSLLSILIGSGFYIWLKRISVGIKQSYKTSRVPQNSAKLQMISRPIYRYLSWFIILLPIYFYFVY